MLLVHTLPLAPLCPQRLHQHLLLPPLPPLPPPPLVLELNRKQTLERALARHAHCRALSPTALTRVRLLLLLLPLPRQAQDARWTQIGRRPPAPARGVAR
jgi:hypothetical protein